MPYNRPIPDSKPDPKQGGKDAGLFSAWIQAEKLMQIALVLPCAAFIGWLIGAWLDHRLHQSWIAIAGIVFDADGKGVADLDGEKAEGQEIVEFESVSDHNGHHMTNWNRCWRFRHACRRFITRAAFLQFDCIQAQLPFFDVGTARTNLS